MAPGFISKSEPMPLYIKIIFILIGVGIPLLFGVRSCVANRDCDHKGGKIIDGECYKVERM